MRITLSFPNFGFGLEQISIVEEENNNDIDGGGGFGFGTRRNLRAGGGGDIIEATYRKLTGGSGIQAIPSQPREEEVFLTSPFTEHCNADLKEQVWELKPVDSVSGTWYIFKNKATRQCLTTVPDNDNEDTDNDNDNNDNGNTVIGGIGIGGNGTGTGGGLRFGGPCENGDLIMSKCEKNGNPNQVFGIVGSKYN